MVSSPIYFFMNSSEKASVIKSGALNAYSSSDNAIGKAFKEIR